MSQSVSHAENMYPQSTLKKCNCNKQGNWNSTWNYNCSQTLWESG